MKGALAFTVWSLALVAAVLLVARLWLDGAAWAWLAAAGALAFALQFGLNRALATWRRDPKRFVAGILLGATLRVFALAVAIGWVWVGNHEHPVAFLLGFAGFLCTMLMIEAGLENAGRAAPGT